MSHSVIWAWFYTRIYMYLSCRRTAKVLASLCVRAVSPGPHLPASLAKFQTESQGYNCTDGMRICIWRVINWETPQRLRSYDSSRIGKQWYYMNGNASVSWPKSSLYTYTVHFHCANFWPSTLTFKTVEKSQQTFLEPTRQDEQFDI